VTNTDLCVSYAAFFTSECTPTWT